MFWCRLIDKRPWIHRARIPQLTGPGSTDNIVRSGLIHFTLDGPSARITSLGAVKT